MVQLYANNQTGIANSPEVTVIRPTANLNIQCDNIVNPPNGEFIFSTYRTMSDGNGGQIVDPSSICEMTGTSSGNIITITSFAPGNTDTGNQVGDRVVFRPGAHWANTVAKRLDETGDWAVNQDKLAETVADITSENNWILPNTGIITQSSGLIGTFSNINYYISGKKYSKTSIANKTYTATKDTYVFINASGTVTYTEVTVGAAAPATPANSVLVAVVTTNASAITNITLPNHAPITASKLDFTTLTLGVLKLTAQQSFSGSTTPAAFTGLALTITPTTSSVTLDFYAPAAFISASTNMLIISMWQGSVGGGTRIQSRTCRNDGTSIWSFSMHAVVTGLTVGTPVTFNIAGQTTTGTGTLNIDNRANASASYPGVITFTAKAA